MQSLTRLHDRRKMLAGAGLGALMAASSSESHAAPASYPELRALNVRDYGAKGDGSTDDADAFLRSIEDGRRQRLPVWIPDGNYRLSRPLSVHAQGIVGNPYGSWVSDVVSLPVLMPEDMTAPALTMEAGGSITGIEVRYPNDDPTNPIKRPAAIRLGETGATIRCVKISHPWIGIDTVAVHTNPGRTVVENVFVSGAHKNGLHFSGAADVCLFRNVEVWTPPSTSGTFLTEGTAFHFQRGDGIRLTDCFAFGANRGFLFTESGGRGPLAGMFTGYLSNCLSDFCNTGIEVRGDHRITITGGSNWSHHSCLRLEQGRSTLLASSVEMASNANSAIYVGSAKDIAIQGCRIERPHVDFSGPAIQLVESDQAILTGNVIRTVNGTGILVEGEHGRLMLHGNIVEGGINDQSKPTSLKRIDGNLAT